MTENEELNISIVSTGVVELSTRITAHPVEELYSLLMLSELIQSRLVMLQPQIVKLKLLVIVFKDLILQYLQELMVWACY